MKLSLVSLLGQALLISGVSATLSPVTIKGTKLYTKDGDQFFVKGITYQPSEDPYADPLLNARQCRNDAGMISEMGANTIRVFQPSRGFHDQCMEAFEALGIYVWVDIYSPDSIIDEDERLLLNDRMVLDWARTIEGFSKYNNTLLFTVADNVVASDTDAAKYVKSTLAVLRDYKRSLVARQDEGYRDVPLIYNMHDDLEWGIELAEYLTCGDAENNIEAIGINNYEFCGDSKFYEKNGPDMAAKYEKLGVPVLFSESVCTNKKDQRHFEDAKAILGKDLSKVFSGVMEYEWAQKANSFGVVTYPEEGDSSRPERRDEYFALASVYKSTRPESTPISSHKPSKTAFTCPSGKFGYLTNEPLPTVDGFDADTMPFTSTSIEATETAVLEDDSDPEDEGPQKDQTNAANVNEGSAPTGAAIGGIVAGSVLAVAFAGIGLWFFLSRRRKQKQGLLHKEQGDDDSTGFEKAELPGAMSEKVPTPEMDGTPTTVELHGSGQVTEMDGGKGPIEVYELPAEKYS